jgi:hypothetical protein
MAKIRYIGNAQSVSLPVDEGPDLVFANGEVVEVEAKLAKALIEQGTFEAVSSKRSST